MRIERVGDVSVWWIARPRGARLGPRTALAAALVILPLFVAVLAWVRLREERLWPWTTVTPMSPTAAQYMLRYFYLLLGGFLLAVVSSMPAWRRLRDLAQRDLRTARTCAEEGDWASAGLHLHRAAVLRAELGIRPSGDRDEEIERLDALIAPRLPPLRRLFIYHAALPPALPESPESGFQPRVVPISVAGGWWTAAIITIVAVAMLGHLSAALAARDWRALVNLNFIVEAAVLLAYGYLGLTGLLGRRRYFRFSPGVAELLHFKLRAGASETESIPLRRCDVYLDVTRPSAMLTLVDRDRRRRIAEYELGGGREVIETCLRAVLSVAPEHPLPKDELTG